MKDKIVFTTLEDLQDYCDDPNNSLERVVLGKQITSLRELFFYSNRTAEEFRGIEDWDVSHIQNMRSVFFCARNFNSSLEKWDVSRVETMRCMFFGAERFNKPLNSWNVSRVRIMSGMFRNAYSFNQPLDKWNVSRVRSMSGMFRKAQSFNQNLNCWDVSHVRTMDDMFYKASAFSRPLNNWQLAEEDLSMFEGSAMQERDLPWVKPQGFTGILRNFTTSLGFSC